MYRHVVTPKFLYASTEEVKALTARTLCVRRPAKTLHGRQWLFQGGKPGPSPYSVGDNVCVREPWAQTSTGIAYKADGGDYTWSSAYTMPYGACRFRFVATNLHLEPLHAATGIAEGVMWTRFWRPPADANDETVWSEYPVLAYARWWDSMWARHGIGWDQNPLTWAVYLTPEVTRVSATPSGLGATAELV